MMFCFSIGEASTPAIHSQDSLVFPLLCPGSLTCGCLLFLLLAPAILPTFLLGGESTIMGVGAAVEVGEAVVLGM